MKGKRGKIRLVPAHPQAQPSYPISGNMNGTPSRQPRESLIVLCPIFRVDLNLNRAQDDTSAKTGATAIENDGCAYGTRRTDTAPYYRPRYMAQFTVGSLAGHELGAWDRAALEHGIAS